MGAHIADYSTEVSMALENNNSPNPPVTPNYDFSSSASSSSYSAPSTSPGTPQNCRTRGVKQGIPDPDSMTVVISNLFNLSYQAKL